MTGAFDGVRVLDGSQGLVGPMAAMLLGDFGAEVLKVEPPEGDRAKDRAGYLAWNRNKQRLTLDLAATGDRQRLDAFIAAADVAVFDHGPSELARLGLDAATLTAANPRLIHLWVPPFGTTGQWSDLPAHAAALTGLSGAAHRQGSYADQPVWYVAPIVHYAQAVLAAAAAGAALLDRFASGLGQAVTVSGLHAMAETSCPVGVRGQASPPRRPPTGAAPQYRLYRCGDGDWLFLGALHAHFFQRALKALEIVADVADKGAAIEAKLAQAPCDHWLALFRENDVPAAPVRPRETWLKSDIIRANDLGAVLDHPTFGAVEMPGVGARLEATPGSVRHLAREATPEWLAEFANPRPSRPTSPRRPNPLAGIKVLDLGTVIAGTYAAAILANFGADVVKVEPAEGDPTRAAVAGIGGFINFNRGKRGLGLNLKAPAGRQLFLDLATTADVVVDNFRLGVRERLGIDYAALRAVNPRIISCSVNTYGSRGRDAALPGFDPLVQAHGGMMAAQGGEDNEPVFHTIPVNDVATAALSSFAIIAALNAREITGEGQNVEVSLAAASAMYQFEELTAYAGRPPNPPGSRDCIGFAALDRYYACRDGWLTLAGAGPAHFAALADALGHPEWRDRWDGAQALSETRDGLLAREIAAALADRSRDETADALVSAGVSALPVAGADQAQQVEFLWENGYFERRMHPQAGEVVASRGFAEFNGAPARFERLHPGLGEHSVEILREYGIAPERIRALAEAGVIFGASPLAVTPGQVS